MDTETFQRNLDWVMSIFKTRDPLIIDAFREGTKGWLNHEVFREVLLVAIDCLATEDTETFEWLIYHYDADLYTTVKYDTMVLVSHALVQRGFMPGEDFSCTVHGRLMMKTKAFQSLLEILEVWRLPLIDDVISAY